MNEPSTERVDVINLPGIQENLQAYRAAEAKAKSLGWTLEEYLKDLIEQRGWTLVRFVWFDFGKRCAAEVIRRGGA